MPSFTGSRTIEAPIGELRGYIDWTFFFHAWELRGRYPAILDDPQKGEAARDLLDGANELLDEIVSDGLLRARGVYGFWPAHADGDDIVLDGERFPQLRQQAAHGDSRANPSLADYVAPGRQRSRGSRRCVRSRHPRRRRARVALRGRPRRLPRDHGARRGRPARRGVRRVAPRARPRRVVRRQPDARQARPDRGAVPRHPPGVRLPGLSRPFREGATVPAARTPRSTGWSSPRRTPRSPLQASAGCTSGTRRPGTSRSGGSDATRSRTTQPARA